VINTLLQLLLLGIILKTEVIFLVHDTFIAANTYKGFFSYFDELIYGNENQDVYLIKGGPAKITPNKEYSLYLWGKY